MKVAQNGNVKGTPISPFPRTDRKTNKQQQQEKRKEEKMTYRQCCILTFILIILRGLETNDERVKSSETYIEDIESGQDS